MYPLFSLFLTLFYTQNLNYERHHEFGALSFRGTGHKPSHSHIFNKNSLKQTSHLDKRYYFISKSDTNFTHAHKSIHSERGVLTAKTFYTGLPSKIPVFNSNY
jgi:hypothetical protein